MEIAPTAIDLGPRPGDGCDDACLSMAARLHAQLSNGYTRGASLMPVAPDLDVWLEQHRTARRRRSRAIGLGYFGGRIDPRAYADDVYAINTSAPERQGRPMSAGYQERPLFGEEPMHCARHHVYRYGVSTWISGADDSVASSLVAYLWLYRCGELAMFSSILGHHDHLENDVMYLLVSTALGDQAHLGGTAFYNMHRSGTDGLRFFKERLGFEPGDVEWRA